MLEIAPYRWIAFAVVLLVVLPPSACDGQSKLSRKSAERLHNEPAKLHRAVYGVIVLGERKSANWAPEVYKALRDDGVITYKYLGKGGELMPHT